MADWYDRDGQPMTMESWAARMYDNEYRLVAESVVDEFWVSTVWLGLDHSFDGSKLIFETMVFTTGDGAIVGDPIRYSTFAAAKTGHDWVVARLKRRRSIGREI